MFCGSCGSEIPAGAKFCGGCGAASPSTPAPTATVTPTPEPEPQPEPQQTKPSTPSISVESEPNLEDSFSKEEAKMQAMMERRAQERFDKQRQDALKKYEQKNWS